MKEELRNGRSLRLAVESGFSRAWLAIHDGNLSTLIGCRGVVLVRQHIWRKRGQRLCCNVDDWCVALHVYGCDHYTHLYAWHSFVGGTQVAENRSMLGY